MLIKDYSEPIVSGGNFTWGEYALLPAWGALLMPTREQYKNCIAFFEKVQELIRTPWGGPLKVTSGARNVAYTKDLIRRGFGASWTSRHLHWAAVDLVPVDGRSHREFWNFCDKHWPGGLEHWKAAPTWAHLEDHRWGQRRRFVP